MSFGRRYRQLTCVACALGAILATLALGSPGVPDGPLLDLLVAARAIHVAGDVPEWSPVAVVAVDRRSLEEPELTPYPRVLLAPIWAAVLDGLFEAGAKAVGFDFLFAYSANRFSPDFDMPLLAALGRHRERVVLGRSAATVPALPFLAAVLNDEAALGMTELVADPDGSYRRVPASVRIANQGTLPGLSNALLRRANAPPMPPEVLVTPRWHLETIPTYALIDVLRCRSAAAEALRPAFGGKIVLVGGTLPEEDRRLSTGRFLPPSPTDGPLLHACGLRRLGASAPQTRTVPGVFLHAAAVEAVATGRTASTAPLGAVAALAATTAAIGAALGFVLTPWLAAAGIAVVAATLFGTATVALARDVWVPLALPLGALLAAPILAYVVRAVVEERVRRRIQQAFSRYLSPTLVGRLAADASALRLGGEVREVTVMFADLAGFTRLAATVEPDTLVRLTNRYLGCIVEQVDATGGYVDKFIGDAVMAIWGAPSVDLQHAVHGVRAAMAAVARIADEREAAAGRGEFGFAVKIGLNSGTAVVGNVGTENRYNYTAIGETVNVASRLEDVPEQYGCAVVVGQRTAELAAGEFLLQELDFVRVKGRDGPLAVFQPLVERRTATAAEIERARCFGEALTHYRAMRFAEAAAVWDHLARPEPPSASGAVRVEQSSGPAAVMGERASVLAASPPVPPWDGVWATAGK